MAYGYPRADSPKRRSRARRRAARITRTSPPEKARRPMSDYAVVNPATGETLKEYPTISDDDLRDAIARADKAHREWSASTTVEERAALLRRVGELHAEQRERLAE